MCLPPGVARQRPNSVRWLVVARDIRSYMLYHVVMCLIVRAQRRRLVLWCWALLWCVMPHLVAQHPLRQRAHGGGLVARGGVVIVVMIVWWHTRGCGAHVADDVSVCSARVGLAALQGVQRCARSIARGTLVAYA